MRPSGADRLVLDLRNNPGAPALPLPPSQPRKPSSDRSPTPSPPAHAGGQVTEALAQASLLLLDSDAGADATVAYTVDAAGRVERHRVSGAVLRPETLP